MLVPKFPIIPFLHIRLCRLTLSASYKMQGRHVYALPCAAYENHRQAKCFARKGCTPYKQPPKSPYSFSGSPTFPSPSSVTLLMRTGSMGRSA